MDASIAVIGCALLVLWLYSKCGPVFAELFIDSEESRSRF